MLSQVKTQTSYWDTKDKFYIWSQVSSRSKRKENFKGTVYFGECRNFHSTCVHSLTYLLIKRIIFECTVMVVEPGNEPGQGGEKDKEETHQLNFM